MHPKAIRIKQEFSGGHKVDSASAPSEMRSWSYDSAIPLALKARGCGNAWCVCSCRHGELGCEFALAWVLPSGSRTGLCCPCLQGQERVKSVGSSRAKAPSFQRFHKKPCVGVREAAGPKASERQRQAARGGCGVEHSEHSCPSRLLAGAASRACHAAMFTVNVSSSMSYRGQLPLSPSRQRRDQR